MVRARTPASSALARRAAIVVAALLPFASWHARAAAPSVDDDAARALLAQTNRLRAQSGLSALRPEPRLAAAAARFAHYMASADRYGHEADGREPAQRAQAEGYADCLVAENIAFASDSRGFNGATLADRLFSGWLNSPPHRRNILDGELTEVGIAAAYSPRSRRHYAVQLFGRPRTQALRFALTNGTADTVRYEVGGHRYTLAPGVMRTHEECRAAPLQVAGVAAPLTIEAGARYRFDAAQGALRVQRE
jgi:uncharacterized protein YkwD